MLCLNKAHRLARRTIRAFAILSTLLCVDYAQSAQDNQEVVVLKNGGLFVGDVSERDGLIIVQLPRGGEVRLATETVDFQAPSLQDVYAVLVRRTTQGDPKQHMGLSDWCVTQSLYREADIQLELAARSGAEPRAVDRRRRHLNSLFDAERKNLDAMQRPAAPLNTQPSNSQTTLDSTELQEPSQLPPQLPGNEINSANRDPDLSRSGEDPQASDEITLSEATIVAFRREIQPRLIHGCAASSCHGPTAQGGFEIERVARGRPVTRGMTERNLKRIAQLINSKAPQNSRLMRVTTELHAGRSTPIVSRHDSEQFQQLENWVAMAANDLQGRISQRVTSQRYGSGPSNQAVTSIPDLSSAEDGNAGNTPSGDSILDPMVQRTGFETDILNDGATSAEEKKLFKPLDAFDPEIFNRYASGDLTSAPKFDQIEIVPIPEDPIGRPTNQIAPPRRENEPDDNSAKN